MPQTPITRATASNLARLVIVGMVVQLLVIGYVAYSSHENSADSVRSQRQGCERNKRDRWANAAFQVAHKKYIERVVLAQSVKSDVKRAAREAIKTYTWTAADLTKRAKIDCAAAFPKARLLP